MAVMIDERQVRRMIRRLLDDHDVLRSSIGESDHDVAIVDMVRGKGTCQRAESQAQHHERHHHPADRRAKIRTEYMCEGATHGLRKTPSLTQCQDNRSRARHFGPKSNVTVSLAPAPIFINDLQYH